MARVAASTIVYNGTGISTAGTGKIVSFGNNVIDGNVKNGTATTKGALM
jgi:hypothetical protein